MPAYLLLHAMDPLALVYPTPRGPFAFVGEVIAESLEDVFRRTQHGVALDGEDPENPPAWGTRPDVTLAPGTSPRSTSVGDLVVTPQGETSLVEPVGFTLVGRAEEHPDGWVLHLRDGGEVALPLPPGAP